MSNSKARHGDYEVGYCRPPKHSRFKPGQSGNKKGRPKGARNFSTDVKATLRAPVKVTRDGRPHKVSTQEAALLRLREKAIGGDARALDRLFHLAQAYNNEDVISAVASLDTDDAMVLEIFRKRVLSGAAEKPNSANGNRGAESADKSADSGAAGNGPNGKGKRPNRLRRSQGARSESGKGAKGASHD